MKQTSKLPSPSHVRVTKIAACASPAFHAGKTHLDAGPPDYTFPAFLFSKD